MKKFDIIIILLFSLILGACGSSISTESKPATDTGNNNPGGARPTPTSETNASESIELPVPYPGSPPTITPYPDGYPSPQQIPTYDPYPAGENSAWVLYPVGVQCEDAATSKYQSEQDAEAGLTAAGIVVNEITTTELMVCSACGCPTSAHYRAKINTTNLDNAITLGWESE